MAKTQIAAQSQALSAQQSTTVLQTVQAYSEVLKQEAIRTLKLNVQSTLQRSFSDAQKRLNAGVITRADLAKIEAQLAQAKADTMRSEAQLKISQTRFYQLTGQAADHLETPIELPPIPGSIDDIAYSIEQHPTLQQARLDAQSAQKQYRLSKLELKPSIGLTGRAGMQYEEKDGESKGYLVGLQFNVPLYDSGLNKANRQKATVDVATKK